MAYAGTAGMEFGRTRWRLVWFVLVPSLAAVATLLLLIANGLIAVSFAISGTTFKVTADSVKSTGVDGNGVGFYQFGVVNYAGDGTPNPAAENVISKAELTNLCQSVSVGPFTLRLTAGTGSSPVQASHLVIDATSLSADVAQFDNINIGQDVGTYNNPGLTAPGARGSGPNVVSGHVPLGTFGQTADGVTLTGVKQVANATSATSFTLPNLSLSFGSSC
ncbi:MAG: DUF6230 family protein [Jatrophihabitans sp.]|uniref:DUF6230 family protein n=1 Tax=Jatrophihabitans sp. TaxID=1932789 RepID=UPI003F81D867